MAAFVVHLLLLGCAETPETTDPSPLYVPPPEAAWEPEELQDNIDTALAYGLPNPSTFLENYMALYEAGATKTCPGTNYNFNSPDVGEAGCTTEEGYFFEGVVEYTELDDGWTLHADFRIITPDDHHLSGAGNLEHSWSPDDTRASIYGSYFEDPAENWLSGNPSSLLQIQQHGSNNEALLYGGYTIVDRSFYFETVLFNEDICDQPIGVVQFRDPNGGWFSIESGKDCAPCPTVSYNAQEIDGLCIDLSVLRDHVSSVLYP